MKARIAIVAALPREIAPLVRDWPVRVSSHRDGTMICECDQAIAVCAGMGRERVEHALALAAGQGPLALNYLHRICGCAAFRHCEKYDVLAGHGHRRQ